VAFRTNTASLDLTGYLDQGWGKPFLMASGGWTWVNNGSVKQHSYAYAFTTGVELPVGSSVAVAPFVSYSAAPKIAGVHGWDYGVKTNYRISKEWEHELHDLDQRRQGHELRDRRKLSLSEFSAVDRGKLGQACEPRRDKRRGFFWGGRMRFHFQHTPPGAEVARCFSPVRMPREARAEAPRCS